MTKKPNDNKLYGQIAQKIRELIVDGELRSGTQLPSETDMINKYQVSRGTIRQALATLENEGLIYRIHGSGSYVAEPVPNIKTPQEHHERQIGLVLCEAGDQLNMELLIGAEQTARARGYRLVFNYSEDNVELQKRNIERLIADNISGIILFPVDSRDQVNDLYAVIQQNIPLVLIDRYLDEIETNYVVANNIDGAFRAVEHLIILGNRRIAFIYPSARSLEITSLRDRLSGYKNALATYALPYDESLIYNVYNAQDENINHVLEAVGTPSAIFAANDQIALSIMKTAQKLGIRIPQELALVGFDDLSFTSYLNPPLTTIRQPRIEIGSRACNVLIDDIEGIVKQQRHIEMPTSLIIRESCGVRLHVNART